MAFLKNLLSLGSGIAAANNALLAEVTLPCLDRRQRTQVVESLPNVMAIGAPNLSSNDLTQMFRGAPRLVQLNFVALTLGMLRIQPALDGEQWMLVKNPFASMVDESDLKVCASQLWRKHGVPISLKEGRLNPIEELIEARDRAPDPTPRMAAARRAEEFADWERENSRDDDGELIPLGWDSNIYRSKMRERMVSDGRYYIVLPEGKKTFNDSPKELQAYQRRYLMSYRLRHARSAEDRERLERIRNSYAWQHEFPPPEIV